MRWNAQPRRYFFFPGGLCGDGAGAVAALAVAATK
jgi:hypothetical protein